MAFPSEPPPCGRLTTRIICQKEMNIGRADQLTLPSKLPNAALAAGLRADPEARGLPRVSGEAGPFFKRKGRVF